MNQSSKLRIAHMMFLILLLAAGSLLQSGQRIMAENVKDTIGGTCVLSSDDAEQFPQDLTNATNFSIENVGFNTQKNEKVQSSFITKKTELSPTYCTALVQRRICTPQFSFKIALLSAPLLN